VDEDFSAALQQWQQQVNVVRTGDGNVQNTISGGTQHGPVVQGRDFTELTFTSTPAPPSTGENREPGGR
jgi:hypothetical protein